MRLRRKTKKKVGTADIRMVYDEPEDEMPDFSFDPSDGLLSVLNPSTAKAKACFLSLEPPVLDKDGAELPFGKARADEGEEHCVTIICSVPPNTVMDVGFVSEEQYRGLRSDVHFIVLPPPQAPPPRPYAGLQITS